MLGGIEPLQMFLQPSSLREKYIQKRTIRYYIHIIHIHIYTERGDGREGDEEDEESTMVAGKEEEEEKLKP